jgi:hypothetical protein
LGSKAARSVKLLANRTVLGVCGQRSARSDRRRHPKE